MNRIKFAFFNILDKLLKILKDPRLFIFYFNNYIVGHFKDKADVYIVSYPKAGRTWLRYVLDLFFNKQNKSIDDYVHFSHNVGTWVPMPPRLNTLKIDENKYVKKRIVLLMRDPRDILVSSYYHLTKREKLFSGTFSDFIKNDDLGIKKIVKYYNLWAEYCIKNDNYIILYYEKMKENLPLELFKLFDFINIEYKKSEVITSCNLSTIEKMKKVEENESSKDFKWLKPVNKKDTNSYKVRKGMGKEWMHLLSKDEQDFLTNYVHNNLSKIYEYKFNI